MSYTSKAQIGMILGIMALVAAIGLYASVLGYAIHQYGSIDGFLKYILICRAWIIMN